MRFENCKTFKQLEYTKQNIVNPQLKQIYVDILHLILVKHIINIKFNTKQLNTAIQLPVQQHNIIIYDFKPTIKLNLFSSSQQFLLRRLLNQRHIFIRQHNNFLLQHNHHTYFSPKHLLPKLHAQQTILPAIPVYFWS
ncbi:hypothetical protein KCU65_g4958, partial [Aureobasidium melanogenum]